jgi:hypothetical protein
MTTRDHASGGLWSHATTYASGSSPSHGLIGVGIGARASRNSSGSKNADLLSNSRRRASGSEIDHGKRAVR